jgi:hypothetical protein
LTTVCGTGGDIRFCGQKQTLILSNIRAKFPIPENCSAYVPMILKEFCSSKINGLVMKNFFREIVTL